MTRPSHNATYIRLRARAAAIYGTRQQDIAAGLGVTEQTLKNWSCGRVPIPMMVWRLLDAEEAARR